MILPAAALRPLAVMLVLCVAGCDATWPQMRESLREEGVADPWAVEKMIDVHGEWMLAALDDLHPLGSEFCVATRHLVPNASHPLSPEKKRNVRSFRAIAWAPCYAVRAGQFHALDGKFSEPDILAALTAVETLARSGPDALKGVHVERPTPPAGEIAEFVKPEKFRGVFSDSEIGMTDWPRGSIEIGFNLKPDTGIIDPLSFSVMVANGKVDSIKIWRMYSGGEY